jgi:hypothetical protein
MPYSLVIDDKGTSTGASEVRRAIFDIFCSEAFDEIDSFLLCGVAVGVGRVISGCVFLSWGAAGSVVAVDIVAH